MYLIIDFGLTKLANKVKKKTWEKDLLVGIDTIEYIRNRRGFSSDKLRKTKTIGKNKAGREVNRGNHRWNIRNDNNQPQITRKYKSGEKAPRSTIKNEMIADTNNFTDVRKVEDKALSKSGYMGFKNTPNSYFEESIPLIETGKKTKVKSRVSFKY